MVLVWVGGGATSPGGGLQTLEGASEWQTEEIQHASTPRPGREGAEDFFQVARAHRADGRNAEALEACWISSVCHSASPERRHQPLAVTRVPPTQSTDPQNSELGEMFFVREKNTND